MRLKNASSIYLDHLSLIPLQQFDRITLTLNLQKIFQHFYNNKYICSEGE